MGKGYRQGRLGEEIKKLISDMLLRELKDPRLFSGLVSISAVDVTSDGSYATVYVSALTIGNKTEEESKEEKDNILLAFQSAKGLIKREIGKNIKIKHIPELIFKLDTSMEYGQHIDQVISRLGIEHDGADEEENEE